MVLGLDGRSIDSAVQSGVDGLVVEAFGRGNSTTAVGQAVSRASAAGVPVILTSRCPVGRVEPIYGSGEEEDAIYRTLALFLPAI